MCTHTLPQGPSVLYCNIMRVINFTRPPCFSVSIIEHLKEIGTTEQSLGMRVGRHQYDLLAVAHSSMFDLSSITSSGLVIIKIHVKGTFLVN